MTITVYTKPNCQPCRATKRYLNENNIPYTEADATHPDNTAAIRYLGHQAAPVVLVTFEDIGRETSWSGFNPNQLRALKDLNEGNN